MICKSKCMELDVQKKKREKAKQAEQSSIENEIDNIKTSVNALIDLLTGLEHRIQELENKAFIIEHDV